MGTNEHKILSGNFTNLDMSAKVDAFSAEQ
jgi:hypothetical protein